MEIILKEKLMKKLKEEEKQSESLAVDKICNYGFLPADKESELRRHNMRCVVLRELLEEI